MASTHDELNQAAEVLGAHLSIETQHGETYRPTTSSLAARLSLPEHEIDRVMRALATDDYVPVTKDGDVWVVSG